MLEGGENALIDMREFGRRLAELRHRANLRQKDLAVRCSVSVQAVSKWENGKSYPDMMIIDEVAKALGVSINELFEKDE